MYVVRQPRTVSSGAVRRQNELRNMVQATRNEIMMSIENEAGTFPVDLMIDFPFSDDEEQHEHHCELEATFTAPYIEACTVSRAVSRPTVEISNTCSELGHQAQPSRRAKKTLKKSNIRDEDVCSTGRYCSVRRHWRLACAVVSFASEAIQAAVLLCLREARSCENRPWWFGDMIATIRLHHDKRSGTFDNQSVFFEWSRAAEAGYGYVSVISIVHEFDAVVGELLCTGQV
eukprot:TRINITY_DN40299_c0_g1_i1.p1 TRINITY_DN40299_c0_g1~~TRINITY_DN40299_c0_g1_i1.p1  ORF type:complete len:231 (-),score=18.64 TRINITY_DN40299_c0_g1_i1:235-927(-)